MKKLMIPGPTEVSPRVLEKLGEPIRAHYGADWTKFYFEVVGKVQKVFQTRNSLFILATTSSGAMEMAVAHAVEPGGKILICLNGFLGERFEEMAVSLGATVVTTRSRYGEPITAEQVRVSLQQDPGIRALAVVHNETSTGVASELSGITAAARENGVLTIVDAVSSMGAVDLPIDTLGVDFCITGTQKCMGAPCGLAFLSVSQQAWEAIAARQEPVRGWYLNLNVLKKYQEMWLDWHPQGPVSAAVSLYMALNQSLDEIFEEGLEQRVARHTRARNAFRDGIRATGLHPFVEDHCASCTVTAVRIPEGVDGADLRKRLEDEHDILVGGGLGEAANTVIRVGHMSRTASPECLVPTIEAIERELGFLGTKIEAGLGAQGFNESWARDGSGEALASPLSD